MFCTVCSVCLDIVKCKLMKMAVKCRGKKNGEWYCHSTVDYNKKDYNDDDEDDDDAGKSNVYGDWERGGARIAWRSFPRS